MTHMGKTALLALMAFLGLGCSGAPNKALSHGGGQGHHTEDGEKKGAYHLDLATLKEVLPNTIEALQWGVKRVKGAGKAIQATALTLDDREVLVKAERQANGAVSLRVKVGYFGDAKLEAAFHRELSLQIKAWRERKNRKRM